MNTRSQRKAPRPSRRSGFNMVEIAICLAIIGIALVAIVGVMPTGMRASQDNREETIIDQDARYLMQAIRIGAPGDGQLASQVESVNGAPVASAWEVIGRLSTPGTNQAVVRAISGPAAERSPASAPVAFRYQLTTQVTPLTQGANPSPELAKYLHEVRLRFVWPLRPDGTPGARLGTSSPRYYRMLVSGQLVQTNINGQDLYLFRP